MTSLNRSKVYGKSLHSRTPKSETYLLCKPRLLIESLFSLVFKRFSLLILIVKTPWIEYPFVKVVMDYHYCFILGWSLKVATWMVVQSP